MRTIFTIFKKELMRFLTDRRMLLTLLLPGVMIYVIYSLMGSLMLGANPTPENITYVVYVQNQPEQECYAFEKLSDLNIRVEKSYGEPNEELKNKIDESKAHIVVIYEQNFDAKMREYSADSGKPAPVVKIFYNSNYEESVLMYEYYSKALDAFEYSIANKFDVNIGDLANAADTTTYILKMILPMMLITLIYSGCMTVTTESIAGEKERGTIATLLVTPVKRHHLVLGKVFALSLLAIISGSASFAGLVASLPMLLGMEITAIPYGFTEYAAILAVVFMTVLLFTILLMILSTFAKSIKEATGFAGPLVILLVLLSLATSLFPTTSIIGYFIPFFNIVICLTSIVALEFNLVGLLITLGVDIIVFLIGVAIVVKMFDNEKIMFGK